MTHNPETGLDCVSAGAVRRPSADATQSSERQQTTGDPTPGPWECSGLRPTVEALVCGMKQTIATTLTLVRWDDAKAGYIDTGPERDANARLIAAAPDMLEALKEAAACLEDVATGKGGWSWEEVLQDMQAAIAKAEGRDR